jgi:putative component of toxin-antitoxin plasmid stabilization module
VDVREYLTADGRNPYREWLNTLDVTPRARIQARVLRLSTGISATKERGRRCLGSARHVRTGVSALLRQGRRATRALAARRRQVHPVGRRSASAGVVEGVTGANVVARRSEDWNVGLAKDLRDAAFAREFLMASIDEGVDLQLALGKVIRAMGV